MKVARTMRAAKTATISAEQRRRRARRARTSENGVKRGGQDNDGEQRGDDGRRRRGWKQGGMGGGQDWSREGRIEVDHGHILRRVRRRRPAATTRARKSARAMTMAARERRGGGWERRGGSGERMEVRMEVGIKWDGVADTMAKWRDNSLLGELEKWEWAVDTRRCADAGTSRGGCFKLGELEWKPQCQRRHGESRREDSP
ncbi:hypothetical protein DFH06DRAFT_1126355 [Mycena polygramma]|nr:hypothetical protein DFH06DRAFT_1126355 [Mycena polygramma]